MRDAARDGEDDQVGAGGRLGLRRQRDARVVGVPGPERGAARRVGLGARGGRLGVAGTDDDGVAELETAAAALRAGSAPGTPPAWPAR
ncbi:hypothetical protein [Nocardioides korecus]